MANALEGSLPQLQNLRVAFEGALYVMTDERFYVVDEELRELSINEFWKTRG